MELRDLYQDVILDHSKHPRNFGTLGPPAFEARGNNPLCGDRVTVYLTLDGDRVADVRFEAKGCAISVASASMMTELIKGRPLEEVRALFSRFHAAVTAKNAPDAANLEALDGLAALIGVRDFPTRVKCATLAWHAMSSALDGSGTTVKTE
ncbi:MAG: SUF system NifU family Fe-S cluster assembly protein [Alphaproteobacteria bacterium]|nr:SUF system NifU family Fe-S cluster assembly protein [Alphaproteobacteria bacterium]